MSENNPIETGRRAAARATQLINRWLQESQGKPITLTIARLGILLAEEFVQLETGAPVQEDFFEAVRNDPLMTEAQKTYWLAKAPHNEPLMPVIEVNNAWTIYGMDAKGKEVAQKMAQVGRPQDWGDPRWHYELFHFTWEVDGKRYLNHCHCWTDLVRKRGEYPGLFAQFVVTVLQPGDPPELCGRTHLAEEDFWNKKWGPMPPMYIQNEENFGDYDG